jgi:hypothetical protein
MSYPFERLDRRSSKLGVRGWNPTTEVQFGEAWWEAFGAR